MLANNFKNKNQNTKWSFASIYAFFFSLFLTGVNVGSSCYSFVILKYIMVNVYGVCVVCVWLKHEWLADQHRHWHWLHYQLMVLYHYFALIFFVDLPKIPKLPLKIRWALHTHRAQTPCAVRKWPIRITMIVPMLFRWMFRQSEFVQRFCHRHHHYHHHYLFRYHWKLCW